MERLTKKVSKTVQDKYSLGSYLHYDFANADDTNKLLNKLGVIEDFMEEQGFESLEELKDFMQDTKNAMLDALKIADRWNGLKNYVDFFKDHEPENITIATHIFNKMQELEKE